MRNIRIIAGIVMALALLLGGYLTLSSLDILGLPARGEVRAVPAGHQEVAWIAPATSDETWERLVAAIRLVVQHWREAFPESPVLQASFDRAFLDLTADVPEVGLYFQGREDAVLWVRWYKLTGEIGTRKWLDKLVRRQPGPIAVIGGDTSDRAVALARALAERAGEWYGPPPPLLITTATADRYYPEGYHPGGTHDDNLAMRSWPRLMEVYKGRSFRFSFTNARMADAVLEFLQQHPEVWLPVKSDPAFLAGIVAGDPPWGTAAGLAAGGYFHDPTLCTFAWTDDRYSLDLADRFGQVFLERFKAGPANGSRPRVNHELIAYGVGDYNLPNPKEGVAAELFSDRLRRQHQMLALPTSAPRARRFLRTLCSMAPTEMRNLVAISGDSITFNQVYRDRDVAWNILDMPVPLVFFSHRNPVSERAGFGQTLAEEDRIDATGTQDLLLYVDIFQAVVLAAFQEGDLLADAEKLNERLRQTQWFHGQAFNAGTAPEGAVPLFNAGGDRNSHTGEHLVWLRPVFSGDRVLPQAAITVWRIPADDVSGGWRLVAPTPFTFRYDLGAQGNPRHAADEPR
jgi:hypothetical protein